MQSAATSLQRSAAMVACRSSKRRLAERMTGSGANFHTAVTLRSAQNPGPVEKSLKAEYANYVPPEAIDPSVVRPGPDGKKQYSAKIKRLVEEISHLTLLETLDLTELLKETLGMGDSDLLLPFAPSAGGASAGGAARPGGGAAAAAPAAAAPVEEKKAEVKTHVDIKLKSFDAKNKIKVIKEIRGVTSLGLKEAKDLVESAPCTILQKVKAEEAAKIVEKLKAETGGEYELI